MPTGYSLISLTTGTGFTLGVPNAITGDLINVRVHADVIFNGTNSVYELHQDNSGGTLMDSQTGHDFGNGANVFVEVGTILQGVVAPATGTKSFALQTTGGGNGSIANATWVAALYRPLA